MKLSSLKWVPSFVAALLITNAGIASADELPSCSKVCDEKVCIASCTECCFTYHPSIELFAGNFCTSDRIFASTAANETNHYYNTDWEFGFKAGLEARCHGGNWALAADFTYLEGDATGQVSAGADGAIDTLTAPGAVSSSLDYEYLLLDLTASRTCCWCEGLEVTPYAGFRSMWYESTMRESVIAAKSRADNDFNPFGFVFGLGTRYNAWRQFNFHASAAVSYLSGENKFTKTAATAAESATEKVCLSVNSYEGKFGFDWEQCCCDYSLNLGLGYEVTQWQGDLPSIANAYDQHRVAGATQRISDRSWTIHALVFTAGMDF
jgi:hypothetical protein